MQKVAGKSIPQEKYVCRKARKFFLQGNRLLLPALEFQYFFNGIQMLDGDNLKSFLRRIDKAIRDLEALSEAQVKANATFYDDLCLARFLKGNAEREIAFPAKKTLVDISVQVKQGRAFAAAMDGEEVPVGCEQYTPTDSDLATIKYSIVNLESVLKQASMIKV